VLPAIEEVIGAAPMHILSILCSVLSSSSAMSHFPVRMSEMAPHYVTVWMIAKK
jgi:hypothetical protein